jgi:hypothetical protein
MNLIRLELAIWVNEKYIVTIGKLDKKVVTRGFSVWG